MPIPGPHQRTVAFVSLGCAKNLVDSEKMLAMLAEAGLTVTSDPSAADVIVVNTCGFIQPATDESLEAIRRAARAKRRNGARLVVAGCLATRMKRKLLEQVPEIDAVVGVNQRDRIVAAALGDERAVHLGRYHPQADSDAGRLRLTPRHYAYLRVSEGCSRGCAFCTIPAIRGPLRSKPVDAVLAEARELIADGAVELNVIGQDITSYGRDLHLDHGLTDLIGCLDRLDGARWIRLLYLYPAGFDARTVEAIASARHVVPYVDLPLQHVNDRILERMRRRTSRRQIESLLRQLRELVPNVTIRTTFIAGLPGETDAEHRELLRFVEDFKFDMMGVFCYCPEPGTPAARMGSQVSEETKLARREELMLAQQKIVLARNASRIGHPTEVLIDSTAGRGPVAGRTAAQAPEVDSITWLTRRRDLSPGQLVPARIIGYKGYDSLAEWEVQNAK